MRRLSAFLLFVAAFVSCDKSPQVPVLSGRTVLEVDVEELSGLCLNAKGDALLACGDDGDVKSISFKGETAPIWSADMDMEGITLNPSTGDMYIAVEGKQEVLRLAAPDYDTPEVMFQITEAVEGRFFNDGLEGITYYKNGRLLVGSQKGAYIWLCKLDGTILSRISIECFASEVADLCYDPEGDYLWVLDSEKKMMYICSVRGELIQAYDIKDIENAEAICVDRKNGCVWIGSDEKNPKIYRYGIIFM
jgi:uncharacterized protein YjiK